MKIENLEVDKDYLFVSPKGISTKVTCIHIDEQDETATFCYHATEGCPSRTDVHNEIEIDRYIHDVNSKKIISTEEQLKALVGKRIVWRDKTHYVKSAKQINTKYLFITDSKTMNLDEQTANNLLATVKILD